MTRTCVVLVLVPRMQFVKVFLVDGWLARGSCNDFKRSVLDVVGVLCQPAVETQDSCESRGPQFSPSVIFQTRATAIESDRQIERNFLPRWHATDCLHKLPHLVKEGEKKLTGMCKDP